MVHSKEFCLEHSQPSSCLLGKENNPAAHRYETQKADVWFTVDVYFSIFIFSHDRLNILMCDHNHLYNYSYLTCKSKIEGCIGAY